MRTQVSCLPTEGSWQQATPERDTRDGAGEAVNREAEDIHLRECGEGQGWEYGVRFCSRYRGQCVCGSHSSCVRDEQLLDECVIIEDANGGAARRPLAMVDIVVKGLVSQTEVAVAPDEVLKGKVLFAISLGDPDHRIFFERVG